MPVKNYGVLTGTVVSVLDSVAAAKIDAHGKPHYHVEVNAGGTLYRAAVNVLSDNNPPDLQFYLDDSYQHAILATVKGFTPGFRALESKAGTGALDYIREGLLDIGKMTVIPPMDGPGGRDLDDIMNQHFQQAIGTPGALVYFFGSGYSDKGKDEYFGFTPADGIHDIHMNQGSTGSFADENGAYQDGAILIYYPDKSTWSAMFTKFQSEVIK
jgi:uncharacterized protein YukJ